MSLKDEKGVGGLTPEKIVGHQSFIMNGQMTFAQILGPNVRGPSPCDSILPDRNVRRLSRTSDVSTSRSAARRVCRSGRLSRQRKKVLETLRANDGLTSAELAQLIGGDRYLCSRRLPDLRNDGKVKNCPHGDCYRCYPKQNGEDCSSMLKRKCAINQTMAITWWIKHLDAGSAPIESD